jgi:hypothetical protein
MGIIGVSDVATRDDSQPLSFGETMLVPACSLPAEIHPRTSSVVLEVYWE